jgi:GrpB-like predicted nucleotidyltransferase (UPF0157 family)
MKISETEKDLTKNGVVIYDLNNPSIANNSVKSLHDMSIKELGQLFPIILQDYSDTWIDFYQAESKLLIDSFPQSDIIKIDHIGSTAIPGLKAKPTIDILLQVSKQIDIQKLKYIFKSLDYFINEHFDNPPPHFSFVKGYTPQGFKGQAYHVHIRYKGDWDEIRFRDYLSDHKDIAEEYEALKLELAEKHRNDREAYTNSKTDFIEKINKLTRKQCTNVQHRV